MAHSLGAAPSLPPPEPIVSLQKLLEGGLPFLGGIRLEELHRLLLRVSRWGGATRFCTRGVLLLLGGGSRGRGVKIFARRRGGLGRDGVDLLGPGVRGTQGWKGIGLGGNGFLPEVAA
ncbi:MAG: uncharacterized protein KVP18_001206 [Porospora cf. gigantea A]|uniref:uncharacterized protein n=1 Tax=Porospora cf. gigantea A TaxID=2853593 RepID=UPI003559FCEC|nr:MAG: hypothetical protein KVP18_001206 [Porospora cf. gigantea A]